MLEKTLRIRRRLLGEDHPDTASAYIALAANLYALGKYPEACDQWRMAVKGLDETRLRVAFTGLERAGTDSSPRPALAAVLARLGRPDEAWRSLEEDFGRGRSTNWLLARIGGYLPPSELNSATWSRRWNDSTAWSKRRHRNAMTPSGLADSRT